MSQESPTTPSSNENKPRSLSSVERRVFGALVEKAKTTPDAYPLTLNALRNACNQKSNRSPQMQLHADDVLEAADKLRGRGAATEVQGDGRTNKYRHRMYDWLGIDKEEAAVMAELLLRGEQTVGELRARAARMEPIESLAALQPILSSLRDKGLVVMLSARSRGQMLTHTLYEPSEMQRIMAQRDSPEQSAAAPASSTRSAPPTPRQSEELSALRQEVAELREKFARLENRIGVLENR